jgi:NADPH:quinone reductase-like Zn-dependent oxidoreductase
VLVGVLTGLAGVVPTAAIMGKQIRLQGITVGSRELQLEMVGALNQMTFRPSIDESFPLNRALDAFRLQESGRHLGKICIEL